MSLPRIVGISGSPRRPSKATALVTLAATEITERTQAHVEIFDLLDAGAGLGSALQREDLSFPASRVINAIEQADGLIVGTPVYNGGYAGLFKHIFDLIEPRSLIGKPVLITATGGGSRHALVVEHALRPLFGFFEALTIPTAIYASDADFSHGVLADERVSARVSAAAQQFVDVLEAQRQRDDAALRNISPDLHIVRMKTPATLRP